MSRHEQPAREFGKVSKPGQAYGVYELRQGYDTADKCRLAYVRLHGQEPAEVVWAKPGFWLAGPVPTVGYLVGIEQRAEPEPEIETTPLTVVGQLGLF